jgi:hypothetical protein
MLRQLVYLHWKAARWAVLLLVPVSFGLPLLVARIAAENAEGIEPSFAAGSMIHGSQIWAPFFPLVAALAGVAFALTAWTWDHRGNHIYALSLPLPRWEYALLKFVAGTSLLAAPVLALFAGAVIGSALLDMPQGVRTYPVALGMRFLLATIIAYAMTFALAAGTVKTTMRILIALVLFLIGGALAGEIVQNIFGLERAFSPFRVFEAVLLRWPGPFHVFGGSWMLIDV